MFGAFGKFITIFSIATRAVDTIAEAMATASGKDKKAAAVIYAHDAIGALVEAGHYDPALADGLEAEVDHMIELAYALKKHAPAIAPRPTPAAPAITPTPVIHFPGFPHVSV